MFIYHNSKNWSIFDPRRYRPLAHFKFLLVSFSFPQFPQFSYWLLIAQFVLRCHTTEVSKSKYMQLFVLGSTYLFHFHLSRFFCDNIKRRTFLRLP
jgi:hypothetical protein